jgi:hypothetical protein
MVIGKVALMTPTAVAKADESLVQGQSAYNHRRLPMVVPQPAVWRPRQLMEFVGREHLKKRPISFARSARLRSRQW